MTSSPSSELLRRCARVALLAAPCLVACAPASTTSPRSAGSLQPVSFGALPTGRISVVRAADRPALTSVIRDGDPAAAVAIVVVTEAGSQPNAALAAILEQRLKSAGFHGTESRPDPDGFRLAALLSSPEQAASFVTAAAAALRSPITQASDLSLAVRRLQLLQTRPLESVAAARMARCTGELGIAPGERNLDLTTPASIAPLESLRSSSVNASRVAFSSVGPASFVQSAAAALQRANGWDRGTPPADPWPGADAIDVHARTSTDGDAPSLALALRVRDPYAATAIADHAGSGAGPLVTRIGNAPGWRLQRVAATVRPRGACLSFRLARDRASDPSPVESDAARVAALVVHEVGMELAEARADGSVAGLQVLRASDPREAAMLAAWWSLSNRLDSGDERVSIDLGLPPPRLSTQDPPAAVDQRLADSQRKLASDYARARDAWSRPVVDARSAVELGQGEFWTLIASPCGVIADTERDAGLTALAAIAAAWSRDDSDGVTIEPWITTDGVGILAHASPRAAEGPHALARRVTDVAARAVINRRLPERSILAARGTILGMIEPPNAPFGCALGAVASAIAPSHPAWIAPFGNQESIARAGSEAAARWSALADGPLRVAVLANVDQAQADAAIRAADRWMLRRVDQPRACPPLPPASAPPVIPREISLHLDDASPAAVIAVPVQQPDHDTLAMLDLLAEGLDGPDGWIAKSLASLPGASGSARVVGGSRLAALLVDVSAPEARIDDTVRQIRATLERLARGAASPAHLERATRRLAERELNARLDPRRRVADLWSGRHQRSDSISLDRWNKWMSSTLVDASLSVVRLLPGGNAPHLD